MRKMRQRSCNDGLINGDAALNGENGANGENGENGENGGMVKWWKW